MEAKKFVVDTGVVSGPVISQNGVPGLPVSEYDNVSCVNSRDSLVLSTPKSSKDVSINVYKSCVNGTCDCIYSLGGNITQLKPCRFAALIFVDRVPSQEEVLVFEAVLHGVDIVSSDVQSYECCNYNSILSAENKPRMDEIIKSELENGYLSVAEGKPHCVHALGAVSKPDGGIRPITDCSRPEGISVNSNVDSLPLSFQYKSIDDVVDILAKDDYLSVVDIKNAYRSVSINPEHVKYQGIKWCVDGQDMYLSDHRLCFGLRCGPYYFNMISNFVYDKLKEMYGIRLVNYLDDYITLSQTYDGCVDSQNKIIQLLRYLGFQISWHKVTSPAKVTKYLGIEIDSELLELRLPMCKVEKMLELVKRFQRKKVVSKKDIQRLTGLLAHCATVVKGGRTFCRRLYDLEKEANRKNSKVVGLTPEAAEDLVWWEKFATMFNGKSTIKKNVFPLYPTSDASMLGFAAYLGTDWFTGVWLNPSYPESNCSHFVTAPDLSDSDLKNINVLELYPVLVGIDRWKETLKGHEVVVQIDNLQVYYMIRTGRSCNTTCMRWIRQLFWICFKNDIELSTVYIPSKDNVIADTLSRVGYKNVAASVCELLEGVDLCCKEVILNFCRSGIG